MTNSIVLTTGVYDLIKDHLRRKQVTAQEEEILLAQLKGAKQVLRKELPADVVTVNSLVRLKDFSNNQEKNYQFVPAALEKVKRGKYSILSDIALSIVGNKVGDVIEWPFKDGEKKIEIVSVVHQS
ncbi:GreA/GreB family elongation factor [Kaistella sp. G5-32]|uniref:GreA/GreB family elongation factor n=1 Tax=Kaistella gelatinilytica TaxID=2787636 RepID=A0ABS0F9L5_9FLAO|nr:GreA/GreB family elongation factor [Kaistella gelatinilytica]MBF8456408.1 GreA/GreB family elongation factor [Kaistella gelatinilytica]